MNSQNYVTINSIADINQNVNRKIQFDASMIKIKVFKDATRNTPTRAILRLEVSGENIEVICWDEQIQNILSKAVNSLAVFLFSASVKLYRDTPQITLDAIIEQRALKSTKKVMKQNTAAYVKSSLQQIIEGIKTPYYRALLEMLVLKDNKFFVSPGAGAVHHNYVGGMSEHALNTTKNAISIYNLYKNSIPINLELILTATILHDIGKEHTYPDDLTEKRPLEFFLSNHTMEGIQIIIDATLKLGYKLDSLEFILLKNCILGHHGSVDTGAVAAPATIEAVIVSMADGIDSRIEACISALTNTNKNTFTESVYMLGNNQLLRWN